MPMYVDNTPDPRRRRRKTRPVALAPFRGVPRLRRVVEKAMREAMARMQADVAAAARLSESARAKATRLEALSDKWGDEFRRLADDLAWRLVHDTSEAGKRHWIEQAQKALGVPAVLQFDTPQMQAALDNAAVAAASWIKTIPQEHIGRVAAALVTSLRAEEFPEGKTLPQVIEDIGGITRRRARFIARDQLHKVFSGVSEAQQREIGVAEFVWRNAGDDRVVGKPGGLYPKGSRLHGDHWHREGKVYRWDTLPADGGPGQAIGCRCFCQPLLDINKILGL
jgi:uncharacterized protein with gpF-like domain